MLIAVPPDPNAAGVVGWVLFAGAILWRAYEFISGRAERKRQAAETAQNLTASGARQEVETMLALRKERIREQDEEIKELKETLRAQEELIKAKDVTTATLQHLVLDACARVDKVEERLSKVETRRRAN